MTKLLGIDCSTDPAKTGLALGEFRDGTVHIKRCMTASSKDTPGAIAIRWLEDESDVLLALDAPLGWPSALGARLSQHQAGAVLPSNNDHQLFRRVTDEAIKHRLKKQPLDVGANLIARTAKAALDLMQSLRAATGQAISLAWSATDGAGSWRAIEVLPVSPMA